ncbi:hypothetical protein [Caloranaerobacter ferrireducens]|uniref:hypothetical protein n=1 Tax=Caloranaerobacter ferrireducens TaxID=1323370 RepID=UPI00084DE9C2|nr:hypothetical protein [Caloranaerobacter ferrireducens]
MFKLATGYLGISSFEYYELTPRELELMFEGYTEKYKNELEMYCIATKVAIFNAMKGKNHKLFSNNNESKLVDIEEKKKQLDELKRIFT